MKLKLGIKIWSINTEEAAVLLSFHESGILNHIELFTVPSSFDATIDVWSILKNTHSIPFVLHAPHFAKGLNIANAGRRAENKKLTDEVSRFAEILKPRHVIFHPGVLINEQCSIEEAIDFLASSDVPDILIENVPYRGLNDEQMLGYSPEQIEKIATEAHTGICLDIGHAVHAANSLGIDPFEFINSFISLNPSLYHMTDGDFTSPVDSHLPYGTGNFPFREILSLLNHSIPITNECTRNTIEDYKIMYNYLNFLK